MQRYLQRHIEPGLPPSPQPLTPWRHVLVIPACREQAKLVQRLRHLPMGAGQTLVILVLNRPDSEADPDANSELRAAALALPVGSCHEVRELNSRADLYLLDLDTLVGQLPAAQGVGLARKYGCDLAFKWKSEGAISDRWICSTDADATLPPGYFQQLENLPAGTAGATFPFWHAPGEDESCNLATALYELRLHHYVRGLEYAGSPYAFHTLGSCLAVSADKYAQVRGFPKRSGAEDFYLLNKLAKTGPVIRLAGGCIALESRESHRIPFGTGPAVAKISATANPEALPLFDHPACFAALRAVLAAVPALWQAPPLADLPERLAVEGLERSLLEASGKRLAAMGLESALEHCRRQAKTPGQFLRQFHQWFDAFRTLKFIHGIRDAGWPAQPLGALPSLTPALWPVIDADKCQVTALRETLSRHWNWIQPAR